MATQPSPSARQRPRWLWPLVAIAALAIVLTVSGFSYAANQEEHDPFCASCHTEPESTYVQRSTTAPPVDLASFHATEQARCIDCHSGAGVPGRMQAELLGARNAALWYAHAAHQPATATQPIGDANCLKCHQNVTQQGYLPEHQVNLGGGEGEGGEGEGGGEAGPNHWHEQLARWQATSASAATCIGCHPGHSTAGTPATGFQDPQVTRSECEACHQVLRGEE